MLSTNPKERPTIWDILNKSFIKKRVIAYLTEIFSGNYPEASLPNDVDDIYIDSLKEQAEKLGILVGIKENIGSVNNKMEEIETQEKKNQKKHPLPHNKPVDSKIVELEKQKKNQVSELRKMVNEKEILEVCLFTSKAIKNS